MSFPVVAATNTGSGAASTTAAVPLPSGIVAGNLLIVNIAGVGTITTPAGWIGFATGRAYYKIADGTEGATQNFSQTSAAWCSTALRITNFSWVPYGGYFGGADPPSLTPAVLGSAGAASNDFLWISVLLCLSSAGAVSGRPSGYTNILDITGSSSRVGVVTKTATSTTEDPSTWTTTGGTPNTVTIGIRGVEIGKLRAANGRTGTAISATFDLTGLGVPYVPVTVGDLIIVNVSEYKNPSTVTGITDGLGNVYTALTTAGTTNLNPKVYYSIAAFAGPANIAAAATLSSNDVSMSIAVYAGPLFPSVNTLDKNPAATTDATTPYAGPATGTLTGANRLIVGYFANSVGITYSSPTPAGSLICQQGTSGASNSTSTAITSQIVSSTASVTMGLTGSASNAGVQGIAAFDLGQYVQTEMAAFRFYADDAGGETGNTALDAINNGVFNEDASTGAGGFGGGSGGASLTHKRCIIRIRVQEIGGVADGSATDDWQLYYNHNNTTYVPITTSSSVVKAYDSPNLTGTGATTNRLGAGSGSFVAGKVSEDGTVNDLQLTKNNYTELVFAVEINLTALRYGDTLYFSLVLSAVNGGGFSKFTQLPDITMTYASGAWTYYFESLRFSNTASDLTGVSQNKKLSSLQSDITSGSWSGQSLAANSQTSASYFTPPGEPGATGQYSSSITASLDITTGNANLRYAVQFHRVDSSGVIQQSAIGTQATASGAANRYYFDCPTWALGTFNAGDRYRADVQVFNISGSGAQSCTFTYNSSESYVQFTYSTSSGKFALGDSAGQLTFSNSNKTVTNSGATTPIESRATARHLPADTGQYLYLEFQMSNNAAYNQAFGLSNSLGHDVDPSPGLGEDSQSVSLFIGTNALAFTARTPSEPTTYTTIDQLGSPTGTPNPWLAMAYDTGNKTIWFRNISSNSAWYGNSATAGDPTNNTDGMDVSSLSGIVKPTAYIAESGNVATINLSDTFLGPVPPGYTRWDLSAAVISSISKSAVDTLAVLLTDTVTGMLVTTRPADSLAVLITDAVAALFSSTLTSDALAVLLSEATANVQGSSLRSDSLAVLLSEATANILGSGLAFDTLSPLLTDTVQTVSVLIQATDSLAVLITESVLILSTLARSDTLSPLLTDVSTSLILSALTDSLAVLISEVATLQSTLSLNDTLAVLVTESTATMARAAVIDTLSPLITETALILSTLALIDTLAPLLTEASTSALTSAVFDTLAVKLDDVAAVQAIFAVADSVAVLLTEVSNLLQAGGLEFTASDTLAPLITEAVTLAITNVISVADSLGVLLTEAVIIQSALDRTESLGVLLTEVVTILSTLAANDTLAPLLTEIATSLVASGRVDTLAVLLTDNASLAFSLVTLTAADTLAVLLSDAATLSFAFTAIVAADTLAPMVVDVASLVAILSIADSLAVRIDDVAQIRTFVTTLDSAAVLLSDAAAILAKLQTTDGLAVRLDDLAAVAIIIAKNATDTLPVLLTEGTPGLAITGITPKLVLTLLR